MGRKMGRGELGLLIHRHNKEAAVFSFSFSLKAALEEGVVFFIHFAKFRSSSKIAGMNSLRNAISQDAAGDSWVILICHLHTHTLHPHTVHWNTETLTHCDTETHLHAYTGITHLHMSLPLWHAHITSWTGKISHLPNSRCIFPHTPHQTRPHAK